MRQHGTTFGGRDGGVNRRDMRQPHDCGWLTRHRARESAFISCGSNCCLVLAHVDESGNRATVRLLPPDLTRPELSPPTGIRNCDG